MRMFWHYMESTGCFCQSINCARFALIFSMCRNCSWCSTLSTVVHFWFQSCLSVVVKLLLSKCHVLLYNISQHVSPSLTPARAYRFWRRRVVSQSPCVLCTRRWPADWESPSSRWVGLVEHGLLGKCEIHLWLIVHCISLVSCNVTCACAYGVGMFMYAACSDHFKGHLHRSGTMYSVIKRSLHHHF